MNAASPERALPPATTPPVLVGLDFSSSSDMRKSVTSVVTTGSSEMSLYGFTIGKLSDQTGVKIETIRYYEKIGLMPKPPRSSGRQRIYEAHHLSRLRFIKRSRDLGFSLDSVRELLGLHDKRPSCGKVQEITLAHLAAVKAKIVDLKRLERTLQSISKDCAGGDAPDCPIIESLSLPTNKGAQKSDARK